jgi:ADP-ribosylglycohydrolase
MYRAQIHKLNLPAGGVEVRRALWADDTSMEVCVMTVLLCRSSCRCATDARAPTGRLLHQKGVGLAAGHGRSY